jgi:hypothetical protein
MIALVAGCGDHGGLSVDAAIDTAAVIDAGLDASADAAPFASTPECERWWDATWTRSQTCNPISYPAERIADLRARFLLRCAQAETLPQSGFGAAWIDGCIAALELVPCVARVDAVPAPGPWPWFPPACLPPTGGLAAGAACELGVQCAGGWCEIEDSAECGTCAVVSAEGEPWAGHRCEVGTWLDAADGLCRRFPTEAGASCVGFRCGLGFFCSVDNTCQPLAVPGAACAGRDEDCLDPARCIAQVCVARDRALDESCDSTTALCAPGLICDEGGCAAITMLANGDVCHWTGGEVCSEGSCTCVSDGECGYGADYECRPDLASGCSRGGTCAIEDELGCAMRW